MRFRWTLTLRSESLLSVFNVIWGLKQTWNSLTSVTVQNTSIVDTFEGGLIISLCQDWEKTTGVGCINPHSYTHIQPQQPATTVPSSPSWHHLLKLKVNLSQVKNNPSARTASTYSQQWRQTYLHTKLWRQTPHLKKRFRQLLLSAIATVVLSFRGAPLITL